MAIGEITITRECNIGAYSGNGYKQNYLEVSANNYVNFGVDWTYSISATRNRATITINWTAKLIANYQSSTSHSWRIKFSDDSTPVDIQMDIQPGTQTIATGTKSLTAQACGEEVGLSFDLDSDIYYYDNETYNGIVVLPVAVEASVK